MKLKLCDRHLNLVESWKQCFRQNLDDEFKTRLVVNNQIIMTISKQFYRPAEVDLLLGDASKAKEDLGWEPKIKFKELVKLMVESDMKASN